MIGERALGIQTGRGRCRDSPKGEKNKALSSNNENAKGGIRTNRPILRAQSNKK